MRAGKLTQRTPKRSNPAQQGMGLAAEMCADMEDAAGEAGIVADQCQLDEQYSDGMPFRNIVLERLQAARELGPEVEAGFCAMLSHIVAVSVSGTRMSAAEVLEKAESAESLRRACAEPKAVLS